MTKVVLVLASSIMEHSSRVCSRRFLQFLYKYIYFYAHEIPEDRVLSSDKHSMVVRITLVMRVTKTRTLSSLGFVCSSIKGTGPAMGADQILKSSNHHGTESPE